MVCGVGFRLLLESVHRRDECSALSLQRRMLACQPITFLLQLGCVGLGTLAEQRLTRCHLLGQ